MIDTVLLAHAHTLRINRWIGDLAVSAETEFFGHASLTAKLGRQYGRDATVRGLRVEELVQQLTERLMPLLDRSNRIVLRNLKALKEHRRAPAPSVNIATARQVNVAGQQVNRGRGSGVAGFARQGRVVGHRRRAVRADCRASRRTPARTPLPRPLAD